MSKGQFIWEDRGGCNFLLPTPFNPSSHPISVGLCLFALFDCKILHCCIIFAFFVPLAVTLEILLPDFSISASHTPPAPINSLRFPPP